MTETAHKHYCERCGAELLPGDPAPLCVTCWVSDTSVTAPSLLINNDDTWNSRAPSPVEPHARHERVTPAHAPVRGVVPTHIPGHGAAKPTPRKNARRLAIAVACLTVVALMLAIVPAAISDTTPGPVHLGMQQVDKGTDACLANLYTLSADKIAHRASPADIVCPVSGKPYVYTQYQGVTTIACPDASAHTATRIYIRTDVNVPVVN